MFRTTAARAVPKSLASLRTPSSRILVSRIAQQAAFKTAARPVKASPILALAVQQPLQKSLVRYASNKVYTRDLEREKALRDEKVLAIPDLVATDSSVHHTFSELGKEEPEKDVDMMAGVRSDFVS